MKYRHTEAAKALANEQPHGTAKERRAWPDELNDPLKDVGAKCKNPFGNPFTDDPPSFPHRIEHVKIDKPEEYKRCRDNWDAPQGVPATGDTTQEQGADGYWSKCRKQYAAEGTMSDDDAPEAKRESIPLWSAEARLPLPGKNRYTLHIVTRWKRDAEGMQMDRNGKFLLEFVGMKLNERSNEWQIPELHECEFPLNLVKTTEEGEDPGTWLDDYEALKAKIKSEEDKDQGDDSNAAAHKGPYKDLAKMSPLTLFAFHEKNFNTDIDNAQKSEIQSECNKLFFEAADEHPTEYPFQGLDVYEGFLDDDRNGSDAWIWATVKIHHDELQVLDQYNLSTTVGSCETEFTSPPAELAWLTLHGDLDLVGEQEDLLKHVANLFGAFW